MNVQSWYLLDSGAGAAADNMAVDEALLESAPLRGAAVLRFYGWSEPAASFGYAQKFGEVANWTMLRPLVRRPTGGGLVPHDADWTYSLVFPAGHPWYQLKATESYQRVHEWIQTAFAALKIPMKLAGVAVKDLPGQCFIGAEKHDVLWFGRKVAGAAQKRTKAGLLIQGSVQPPPVPLERGAWQRAMCEVGRSMFGADAQSFVMTEAFAGLVRLLADTKYSQSGYNQKR